MLNCVRLEILSNRRGHVTILGLNDCLKIQHSWKGSKTFTVWIPRLVRNRLKSLVNSTLTFSVKQISTLHKLIYAKIATNFVKRACKCFITIAPGAMKHLQA